MGILDEIPNMTTKIQCESSSCQCTTTLYGEKKGNEVLCIAHSKTVAEYVRRFAHGHWSLLGPGSEKKYGTQTYKPNGKWDRVAKDMMINVDIRIPWIQCFETRSFAKQRKRKLVFTLLW